MAARTAFLLGVRRLNVVVGCGDGQCVYDGVGSGDGVMVVVVVVVLLLCVSDDEERKI